MADSSIERFRRVVEAAYGHLEQRRQEVNDLNVFPVADGAYESVRAPAEGTMLTVIREMAHAVSQHLAHMDRQRLSAAAADTEQDELLAEVLSVAARAGQDAVERTPEQLEVLAEAGVVDAGAHGLVVILAGIVAGLRGEL